MPKFDGPTTELEYDGYKFYAMEKVDQIIDNILDGMHPMANDLNLFSGIGDDVMNPPTAWAERIMSLLEDRVDRKKSSKQGSDSHILYYNFSFRLRDRGNRATILFSFTAAIPR